MAVRNHKHPYSRTIGFAVSCCMAFPTVGAAQQASDIASSSPVRQPVEVNDSLRRELNGGAAAQFRAHDSVVNGMLIGLGVGITAGAVVAFTDAGGPLSRHYCDNEGVGHNCTQDAAVTTLLFGTIGAGLGATVDGVRSQRVHGPSGRSSPAPVTLAPLVGRGRNGMLLRMTF